MKKGFTLIELLAVIVILAIIALIATPIILGVVESARKSAAGSSALGYLDAVEKAIALDGLDNIVYPTGNVDILTADHYKDVEVQGKGPSQGTLVVSDMYLIEKAVLCVNNYKVELTGHKINKITKDGCDDMRVLYEENILHGADPVLGEKMIPVMLSDKGVATYADVYKDKWYDYDDKKWANAVILVNSPSKTDYKEGDIIADSDIRAYFVWIPKFSYKIFDMGNYNGELESKLENQAKEIEIKFETRNTTEVAGECITPMGSGLSKATTATKNCSVDDLMTHPAFLSIPSNGFWVAKFEPGYNQNSDVSKPITDTEISTWTRQNAQINAEKPNNIIVKPNVYSWRYASLYNLFMNAYNFNRNLDSHMMKNTEWGAVAYLSHSKYGVGKEVNINNNSKNITGCGDIPGSVASETCNDYKTSLGKGASTTGNITGVYDMSGGTWEYVAACIDGNAGEKSGMDSIIANPTYDKYLDKYLSSSKINSYSNRILGDATGELGPFWLDEAIADGENVRRSGWYAVSATFIKPDAPWFGRGGNYESIGDGQFRFGRANGFQESHNGARLVLTP